jgi:hypothetical protein
VSCCGVPHPSSIVRSSSWSVVVATISSAAFDRAGVNDSVNRTKNADAGARRWKGRTETFQLFERVRSYLFIVLTYTGRRDAVISNLGTTYKYCSSFRLSNTKYDRRCGYIMRSRNHPNTIHAPPDAILRPPCDHHYCVTSCKHQH